MLLEQIYANAYNENQNHCDNSRSDSPECENGEEEAECIELDTFETTETTETTEMIETIERTDN